MADKRVVACNSTGTRIFSPGALAYVVRDNPGNGNDRIVVLGRSRSGRWVEKYEPRSRLCNFRFKTIPLAHPLYDLLCCDWVSPADFALPVDTQAEPAGPAAGCPDPSTDRPEDPPLDDHPNDGRRR